MTRHSILPVAGLVHLQLERVMGNFKRIGVLGGMGPQATILFQQRVVVGITANDDASHVPLLVDMNPQIPSRLDWLLRKEGRDPAPVLADMAKGLESGGASALAMPCNTAHFYAPQITAAVNIPLLNMIELAGEAIVRIVGRGATVGILASPATQQIDLFKNAFAKFDLDVIYPEQAEPMLASIRRIKSQGATVADNDTLNAAAAQCEQNGASCLLIGCSEFSLLANDIKATVPVVDSLDVLVAKTIAFSLAE